MMRISSGSGRVLLTLVLLMVACERRSETGEARNGAAPARVPAPAPTVTPSSSVSELHVHLDAAHENYEKRDLERAGEELLAAATGLKQAAQDAPAEVRKDLLDAASGLERLERAAVSGTVTSMKSFDHTLARANASLARYHYLRATDAWVARNLQAAGREMERAVDQLETGSRRLGRDLTGEAESFSRHARSVGEQLARGAKLGENEVGQVLKGLGREIDKLDNRARAEV
jgi:hypothetical protein